MRCVRFKRVRVRGQGTARRCAKYSGGRPRRRGCYTRSYRKHRGYRRGHRPFNKGKKCRSFGVNRIGRRTCRSYGGRGRPARRGSGGGMSPVATWRAMQSAQEARMTASESGGGSWIDRMRIGML